MNITEEEEFEFRYRYEKEQEQSPKNVSKPKSFVQDLASDYGDAIMQGPSAMLAKLPETASKIAGKGGELLAEKLAGSGINPYLAAGAGTVAALSPDIMSMAAIPTAPILNTPKAAYSAARRALGFQKRMLKMPISKKSANMAAEVALDRGIIPYSGDPKAMLAKAQELEGSSGSAIGSFLESQGKRFDSWNMIGEFDTLKRSMIPPDAANVSGQSFYKDIQRQINKAINTVRSHGDKPITFKTANEIKGVFQNAVNYNSDANTQVLGRKIAGIARETVDSQLGMVAKKEGNAIAYDKFLQDKKNYGAASRMQEGIQNKIAGEEGDMRYSLPSIMWAAGHLTAGSPVKAAATLGLAEYAKRRGSAVLARTLQDAFRASRYVPAAASLGLRKRANPE